MLGLLFFSHQVPSTKCDGDRPRCMVCVTKNRSCSYLGKQGQTRIAAEKSILESLEKLVEDLRTGTPEKVGRILQQIRGGDHLVVTPHVTPQSTDASPASGGHPSRLSGMASMGSESGASAKRLGLPVMVEKSRRVRQPLMANLQSSLQPLPDAVITKRAMDSFFCCSGKLFHVFSKEQASDCYRAVYEAPVDTRGWREADVCSLMAIASVGAQYLPDTFSEEAKLGFYEVARYLFEIVAQHDPLRAIKICTLLAHYNLMERAMIALTYVGLWCQGSFVAKMILTEAADRGGPGRVSHVRPWQQACTTVICASGCMA